MENEESEWKQINSNNKYLYGNPFAYFFSNYLWIIFLCPLFFYYKYTSNLQKVPIINSFNKTYEWNSSLDPHIFGFISDMHITSKFPNTIINTNSIFSILNETGVEKILIAGDIADNFLSKNSFKHGCQIEDDYIQYKKISDKYPSDLMIVASGNHDEFSVEAYKSSNHFILQYCDFYSKNDKFKKYENFLISKVKYDDIEFFIMNPYHYPTVPSGLGFSSDITTEMLDKIESFLSSHSNSKTRILMTHYPTSFTNSWSRSSSHKTLVDILTSSNLSAILCGDTHNELIIHTKSSLEIHANSVKGSRNRGGGYRYISVDNGYLNDHGFVLNEEKPLAVLTHPIQKKYISDQTDFSCEKLKQSEVRVVVFSENENLNISVKCNNIKNKKNSIKNLKFQRIIRPNQSLYSTSLDNLCNINKNLNDAINESSEFRLVFSGDWNYESNFVCGDRVKLDDEILAKNLNRRKSIISVGILCYIIIFFIWFPFPPFEYFDRISSWISNKRIPKINNDINLIDKIIGLIFGFIVIKSRIYYNQPKLVRISYFIFVLSPFYLPITLMKIGEKTYGFIFFMGYYLNGFYVDLWGIQLTNYFALFVLLPSTIVFSSISYFKQTKKIHFVFLIDIVVGLMQIFLIRVAVGNALFQSASFIFAITSPIFVIIPIIIMTMEVFQILKISKPIQYNSHFSFL